MQGCLYFWATVAQSPSLYSEGLEFLDGQQLSPLYLCSKLHTTILLGEILASIIMCSHIVHLMVAFYSIIQTLLPSLGTFMDGDPREGDDSIVCQIIPLCAPLRSSGGLGGYP